MANYLIVGASSGIGKELAQDLHEEGHQVFGTFHTSASNAAFEMHALDVREADLNMDFVPDTLDGLVYCPGLIDLKPFHRIKAQDFLDDFEVQALGAVKVLQEVMPKLKNSDQASVVLFSTVAVGQGFPFHSKVSMSKGAIEGLTRALAAEWAPKIRVNAVAPSLTQTPLADRLLNSPEKVEANAQRHPLKRVGQAVDIAQSAKFLLSEKASWISGQVMAVDGGVSRLKV